MLNKKFLFIFGLMINFNKINSAQKTSVTKAASNEKAKIDDDKKNHNESKDESQNEDIDEDARFKEEDVKKVRDILDQKAKSNPFIFLIYDFEKMKPKFVEDIQKKVSKKFTTKNLAFLKRLNAIAKDLDKEDEIKVQKFLEIQETIKGAQKKNNELVFHDVMKIKNEVQKEIFDQYSGVVLSVMSYLKDEYNQNLCVDITPLVYMKLCKKIDKNGKKYLNSVVELDIDELDELE